jgi:putative FmdB family regulatory protein
MPIYLYRNLRTGETFEIEQRMIDDALTAHPVSGDPVKRLVQPVGIAFKGSGFYVTDSRGKNGANGSSKGASKGGSDGASAAADGGAPGVPAAKSASTGVAAAAD